MFTAMVNHVNGPGSLASSELRVSSNFPIILQLADRTISRVRRCLVNAPTVRRMDLGLLTWSIFRKKI